MKIISIVGARPQIIKAAALSRIIRQKYSDLITEIIVHTGQHYDENMSKVFFQELEIALPAYNLNIGSDSHGRQSAGMISGLEEILMKETPDYVVLFGDTNSTLAGAIAASKLQIPIAHIEAGLRSYNKQMPEEINRIMCDHVSTFLFTPNNKAIKNLELEGFDTNQHSSYCIDKPGIFNVGDIMYDNFLYYSQALTKGSSNGKLPNEYILATIHRDHNTDRPENLQSIFKALLDISNQFSIDVKIPLHPRTLKCMSQHLSGGLLKKVNNSIYIEILPPVSYKEMIDLERNAKMIMTDSGGVQKEAYFYNKPCIILREETEWVEILETGMALLCGANYKKIMDAFRAYDEVKPLNFPKIFGNGNAANLICQLLIQHYNDTKPSKHIRTVNSS
ncbi:non-hydrolyzing UDP-N-acetylglucosamine 2-epimerase [Marinifilum caeruleilacunae]|uniref:UDP-N-acetylglucosamine 2-epimerase (Non-hydrolyzing) n=1 Tax=Marinifilum caeruleilacunae TaxID=2499076 RepID=A0ABX1WR43_9BACT|nr:UDP-N-acetylglucosamine 2-epimerase (non-hydrolyzing) [Marinifilum caeruleilacunae]NOU58414.1 UDP-N-acetylglucosamine 2-epimerase (non-hydrolyzing) [Marinifilum caeruleilacunae]